MFIPMRFCVYVWMCAYISLTELHLAPASNLKSQQPEEVLKAYTTAEYWMPKAGNVPHGDQIFMWEFPVVEDRLHRSAALCGV